MERGCPAERWKNLGHVAVLKHGCKCCAIPLMRSGVYVPCPWTRADLWLFKPTEYGRRDSRYLPVLPNERLCSSAVFTGTHYLRHHIRIHTTIIIHTTFIILEKVLQWTLQTPAHAISMCAKLSWAIEIHPSHSCVTAMKMYCSDRQDNWLQGVCKTDSHPSWSRCSKATLLLDA